MMRWTNLGTWAVAALCIAGAVTGGGLLARVTSTLDEPMALDALEVQIPKTQPLPPRLALPTRPMDGSPGIQMAEAVPTHDPLLFQVGQNAEPPTVRVVRPAAVQITEQGPTRARTEIREVATSYPGLAVSNSPLAFAQVNQAMNSLNQAKLALKNASKDEDKKRAEEQLQKALNDYFDQDIVRRKKELVEIRKKVEEIEKQLQKRETSKGEIVDLQKKVIVNEVNGLGFFGTPAASPAGGIFSNWPLGNSTFGVQIEKTTPNGTRRVTVPAPSAPAALPSLPPIRDTYSTPDDPAPAAQAGPAVSSPRLTPPAPPAVPSPGAPSTPSGLPTAPLPPAAPIAPSSNAPAPEAVPPPPQASQTFHKVKTITTKFSFPFGKDDLAIKLWATTAS